VVSKATSLIRHHQEFDVGPRLEAYRKIPGWAYMNMDARFWVFKKKTGPEQQVSASGVPERTSEGQ